MRKLIAGILFIGCSFIGGAIGGTLNLSAQAIASYQMFKMWAGGAAISIPSWVDSHYGFSGASPVGSSQATILSVSPNGQFAGLFASRSSDFTTGYYPSGMTILSVMDNTGTAKNTWGAYTQGEFPTTALTGAQLINHESSLYNQNVVVTSVDPFTPNVGGSTINFRPDCGVGGGAPAPTNNCTTAIQVLNNGAKYSSPAIIVGNGAQDVSVDASAPVIALPDYNSIAGYHSAGVIGFKLFGGTGSPAGTVNCTQRCLYIREDGGANTTLYINETGGGTSGWAAK